MQLAARLNDLHVCPKAEGPKPHVGGPIVGPGKPTVLIGDAPAAVVGDTCLCIGPPDKVANGATTVLAGDKRLARLGDTTDHGGVITSGCPTVLVG